MRPTRAVAKSASRRDDDRSPSTGSTAPGAALADVVLVATPSKVRVSDVVMGFSS
jgi:hypothetical protein